MIEAEVPSRDEAQMIASILVGNIETYHDLIRPYEHSVYRMALSFMKNEADAEDVAQEAFLKAFRRLADFRGEAKFSTWLISIAINEARNRLRKQSVAQLVPIDDTTDERGTISPALLRDWGEIPSETLERKEIRLMLRNAIATLSPIYREVVLLRDMEECSIEETAQALMISTGTVKIRLHRARIMLQKQLAPLLKSSNPKWRWLAWS